MQQNILGFRKNMPKYLMVKGQYFINLRANFSFFFLCVCVCEREREKERERERRRKRLDSGMLCKLHVHVQTNGYSANIFPIKFIEGGAKVGLQLYVKHGLFLCYYCIIFHTDNRKPTFAHPLFRECRLFLGLPLKGRPDDPEAFLKQEPPCGEPPSIV